MQIRMGWAVTGEAAVDWAANRCIYICIPTERVFHRPIE